MTEAIKTQATQQAATRTPPKRTPTQAGMSKRRFEPIVTHTPLDHIIRNTDVVFTFCLFGIVLLLVLPISPYLLDFLLTISVALSLLILLIIVYLRTPSEFSVFPTLLLAVTLYRLGLNVASTRLILLDGFAGNVINSFGNFVVRGNYVVGTVVFLILIVINFVVITKGAGRIAEVAARFTLDAMPGKQMAIDADLNAGLIDEQTAVARRLQIQKDADFYGAMDGASKFVRGDAVAGVLITLINVVGGIAIGVFQKGMPLAEALKRYTLLSIGDGLVAQIPALIVSVGAGILVTRTNEEVDLGEHMGRQIFLHPRAVSVAAAMVACFGFTGLPFIPFVTLGAVLAVVGYALKRAKNPEEDATGVEEEGKAAAVQAGSVQDLQSKIRIDTFAIELGYGLLGLADAKAGGDLLERVTGVRQKIARDVGLIVPPVAIRDNLDLETQQYRFLLRGKEIARGSLMPNRWLAMNIGGSEVKLNGTQTQEPVFNLPATWIPESEKQNAEVCGFTVVDAASVMITHLSEILRDTAPLLLEREGVQRLIDTVKDSNPTLVGELLPDLVTVGIVQRVFQNLLRERVSIRHLVTILEAVADCAPHTKNPDDLSEHVRKRLGTYFISEYETEKNVIKALTIDPALEQYLAQNIRRTPLEISLLMDPAMTQGMVGELTPRLQAMIDKGMEPILITTAELRLGLKRFFEPTFPRMVVLAYQELPTSIQVQNVGIIKVQQNTTLNTTKSNAA